MLLLFISCESEHDPFTGDYGVRMNINGKKAVLYSRGEGRSTAFNKKDEQGQTISLSTVTMRCDEKWFYFWVKVSDPDTLVQGNIYPAQAGISLPDAVDTTRTDYILNGEVEIVALSPAGQNIEGVFEFTGFVNGERWVIKHGFFRSQQYVVPKEETPEEENNSGEEGQ